MPCKIILKKIWRTFLEKQNLMEFVAGIYALHKAFKIVF